jgi:flavodoxin
LQVVILHESLTGHTEQAARLIANALYDHQIAARVFPIDGFDPEAISEADLVIAGSWTDGFILVGQKPGRRKKFHRLPDLTGKRAAVFCTYAVDPGHTLDKLTKIVASHGADVVGGLAIRRNELQSGAAELVDRLLEVVSA